MTKTAKTYGDALYQLAREEGCAALLLEELEAVDGILRQNPQYQRLTSLPALGKEERCALLDEAFGGRVHPYLLNFLKILSEKGKVKEFSGCVQAFREQYDEDNGILAVLVRSAVPLTDGQRQRLTQRLGETTGKTIRLSERVDPALLGGLRLEADGQSLDGTVAGRLQRMRVTLQDLTV